MKKEIKDFIDKNMGKGLIQMVISKSRIKDGPSKVKIRPILLKDKFIYQATETVGPKVLHTNYERQELIEYIGELMEERFMQLQWEGQYEDGLVLVSKKGHLTTKVKRHACKKEQAALEHNRRKKYLLAEGTAVPFLVDLGVMTPQGKIVSTKYDKFRQINRFLEFIEDILPRLDRGRELTILDFGCGKSYLTFAMYYYLRQLRHFDVRIIGLDLKEDVIQHCNELAQSYGYEKLKFYTGDIASYEGVRQVDMVVTLYACDTATDYALAKAVYWGAKVILSVPCCQHELNGQIRNEMLSPVLSYGILKERMAALITDGLRAQLLEGIGYETQILEFVDMEHTPKNLLIRGVYTGKKKNLEKTRRCIEELHLNPTLASLLEEQEVDDQ
ncbi:SAM-dependent methyltransferase [Blautia hydrogenotrophica]|uniref:class I SAM-dependent methyltransferase n=1 Tax=Blautia hydrogenotrophica TaxID=53443 RepID=UPI002E762A86|nr:SAM-dependent methyltransferase [Blautia hydrogenotrophica]MEE0461867.1 SAM-dependent methyltransferase [Blautia hydrogenotrophica]